MTRNELLDRARAQLDASLVAIDFDAVRSLDLGRVNATLLPTNLPFEIPADATGASLDALLDDAVFYLLAQTALQYRFWWKTEGATPARYKFDGKTGSMGMCTAFDRAWGTTSRPSAALISAAGNLDTMKAAFGEEFPDPASRCDILTEVFLKGKSVAQGLRQRIQQEGAVEVAHADFVASSLPLAYGDIFLKKAMLACGFVASLLSKHAPVEDRLCAFADYQVPRVLRHFGILRYSEPLAAQVANGELLSRDGAQERAIRAATVLGCEAVAMEKNVTAAGVDWWCFQQRNLPTEPFHLTETTCY